MSEYGELIGHDTVRFVRRLPGPIERVWAYITEAEKRATWLAGGAMQLTPGGRIELNFHNASLSSLPDDPPPKKYQDLPEKMSFGGEVIRCEPPTLLTHTWVGEDEHSEVTYELATKGDEVELTLTHRRLSDRHSLESACGGWHTHLTILLDVLNGLEPQPFWRQHTALEIDYAKRLAAAE